MNISNIVRTNARRIALVSVAAASLTMLSGAALAAESAVSFKAQDLNSTAGVAALYGRITRAAQQVCGARDSFGQFLTPGTYTCISAAVSHAVAQVNSPTLTSFYNANSGKPEAIVAQLR